MTEANGDKPRGRFTLAMLALIFLGPLALAAWLYYGNEALQPEGRANKGVLLEPITSLPDAVRRLRTFIDERVASAEA